MSTMPSLSKQLVFLIMQFLKEEQFEEAAHLLEQETGIFFDLKYFERLMMAGEFDQADRYLSGFINLRSGDVNSVRIFFELRKQKYLEALDRKDSLRAMNILGNDMKVFKEISADVHLQLVGLLTLDDFRENEQLQDYSRDTKAQRTLAFLNIKKLIESIDDIQHKLTFPAMENSRLRLLINQSINWQHHSCKNPRSNPNVTTIFMDHNCEPAIGARTPSQANKSSNRMDFPPFPTAYIPFQPAVAPAPSGFSGWPVNINHPMPSALASVSAAVVPTPSTDNWLKRLRTTPTTKDGTNNQFAESEHFPKRSRTGEIDEVNLPGTLRPHNMYSENDLPKMVVRSFNQGSKVVSMDFHPQNQSILLVGTDLGDIAIWEVVSGLKLVHKSFRLWDLSKLKMLVPAFISKESNVSVKKCIWSSDGVWVGVAFSKNIVHIYHSSEADKLQQHLEIDAHMGSVNDIAFVNHDGQLKFITCGDDKVIKVWNLRSGEMQYTFEGHEEPVHAICPHRKKDIQYIFSTSVDGKIKTLFYDQPSSEISYDAPGHGWTTMAYSDDGSRLFSCGTNRGDACLVEWDDEEGIVKRTYSGLGKRSSEVVKFHTTKKLLAAGDDNQIKFWDMDNINILSITNANGGLPPRPLLRFNKDGSLLAVTTNDNGIKVLANPDGIQLLHTRKNRRVPQEPSVTKAPTVNLIDAAKAVAHIPGATEKSEKALPEALIVSDFPGKLTTTVDNNGMVDSKQRIPDEVENKGKNWKIAEVTDPVQCRSIRLPDTLPPGKIARLQYTGFGAWLLALDTNAMHKLWKWNREDGNLSKQATTNYSPELWLPNDEIDMKNDTSARGPGEVNPCMAFTKNGSFFMSCSGGKMALFVLKTFQTLTEYDYQGAAATSFLAFHPKDNNFIVAGMEDGKIRISNCRTKEKEWEEIKGHEKRITGLAFSDVLNVLVSSGADSRLCVWEINGWEKKKSKKLYSKSGRSASPGRSTSPLADTRVQFHKDQVQLLVVQDNQIAIYDAYKLESLRHWAPQDPMKSLISDATYSCDGLVIYASFCDGSVGVFDADDLKPRCRIAPSAFMPGISSGNIYPSVIAAHPHQPNQFAIGLTDGGVHVIEPAESEGKWCVGPSDNGADNSNDTTGNKDSELPPR